MELMGIAGGLLFLTNLFGVVRTVRSTAETKVKAMWIAFILLVSVIGAVVWIVFGPS